MPLLQPIAIIVLPLSVLTYVMFGVDKRAARNGGWRISEASLLAVSLLGGSPGALLGQRMFRHKTRKQPFKSQLFLIVGLQICALVYLTFGSPEDAPIRFLTDLLEGTVFESPGHPSLPRRFGPGSSD